MPLVAIFAMVIMWYTRYLVVKAMVAIGLGYVTWRGIDSMADFFETEIQAQFGGLQADIFDLLSIAGVDQAITILLSSYVTYWQIRTIGGVVTRLRILPQPL